MNIVNTSKTVGFVLLLSGAGCGTGTVGPLPAEPEADKDVTSAQTELRTPMQAKAGDPRPGLYYYALGGKASPKRLSSTLARETATNGTRVAYTYNSSRGGGLAVRQLSGDGSPLVPVSRRPVVPRSPLLTRYNAAWLLEGGHAQATKRFAGSGGPFKLVVVEASRALPATTDSLGLKNDRTGAPYYLDAEGVKVAAPPIF